MKKAKKAILLVLCAALLVGASVAGTLAYMTSTAKVTNTFTIGNVNITLDETKVDVDGKAVTPAARETANTYKLVPGATYTKDPTVHVVANSEDSWIFVKVENGISAFEAATADGYTNIAGQIAAKGWTALADVNGVYYKEYTSSTAAVDLAVFDNFRIADTANSTDGWANVGDKQIVVTAYAIQKQGLDTAAAAWNEVKDLTVS